MGFWHIYRLLHAKRWLLLLLMLAAAALIFLATAIQANRSEIFTQAKLGLQQEVPAGPNTAAPDKNDAIDDLVQRMSSNAAVIQETTRLLKLEEKARAQEVKRILEQNGQFATYDIEVPSLVDQRIADGSLPLRQRDLEIAKMRSEIRNNNMNQLAKAADAGGGFAVGGVGDAPEDIQRKVREILKVEAIGSLDSSDTNPKYSNFVRVTGKFQREAEANLYVNMFCLAFMDWFRKSNNNTTNQRIQNLQAQLTELNTKLRRARREEAVLKRNPDVGGPDGMIQNATLMAEQKVDMLREKYNDAVARTVTLRQQLASIPPTITVQLPAGEKADIQQLQLELTRAEAEYRKLEASSNLGSGALVDNPADAQKQVVDTLRNALAQAKRSPNTKTDLNQNFQLVQQKLSMALEDANGGRAALQEAQISLGQLKQRLDKLPRITGALDDTREEIKRTLASIATTSSQIESARSTQISTSKMGTLSLISQAVPLPAEDSLTKRLKLMIFGAVLALIVGIVAVVGLDALDNRIKDTRDVEEVLELPIAGVIPAQIPDPRRAPRITYLDPLSPVSEAYRLLRTDILFTQTDHPFQSLLGVGVKPGQGTTTTITNLAITLAQSGKKVILVDADLRRPRLHETFGLPSDRGLTSLLLAQCVLEDALHPTEIDDLMILPAGPSTTQPSELLGSREMRDLHETLKEAADFVLFDSPSAITFADAAILSSFLDATVIVIKANEVPRKAEQDVRALLDRAKANIIGVVLNAMPSDRVDSAHYHGQYYPQGKKKQSPQLPGGGGAPPSLPGSGSSRTPMWGDDSAEETKLRPAARSVEMDEVLAVVDEVNDAEPELKPKKSWRSTFTRRAAVRTAATVEETIEATDPSDETEEEAVTSPAPAFDYSKPYVSRAAEKAQPAPAPVAVPKVEVPILEDPEPVVAKSTESLADWREEVAATQRDLENQLGETTQAHPETAKIVESWREDVEEVRQKYLEEEAEEDGSAKLMPGMEAAPRKRSLLGNLLKR
ncbi:MAG: polysaccharide biosynthesis tyrosine autokinase [Armatimonas sp.]